MKATITIILASLLLIAAAFILEPMVVAQPPAGVVAKPSMTLAPIAIGIIAIGVSCLLAMKFLGSGTVNSIAPNSENLDSAKLSRSADRFSDRLAPTLSWIGISLCGLLIAATIVTAIMSLRPGHDEGGRGTAISIVYFMVIPAAAMLAGLFCLAGALMCKKALQRHSSPALQNALRISARFPLVGVVYWIAGLVIMVVFSK